MAGSTQPEQQEAFQPLPYHLAIRDFLKSEEADVWNWYTSNRVRQQQAESVRFELLKSTYRIDPGDAAELYEAVQQVAGRLGLAVPVTIYQSQNPRGLNASLAYVPREAHIVLDGPIRDELGPEELESVMAHELAHLRLWDDWEGEFLIVDQILSALSVDEQAEPAHVQSARYFRLYSEIFCDRAALLVVGDPAPVISTLVKLETGVSDVNPSSFLEQADEIFSRGGQNTEALTHPEAFIRARALRLWSERGAEAIDAIAEMIEAECSLDSLDLLGQQRVASLTRDLLDTLLAPKWFHTDLVRAHARAFFDEYEFPDNHQVDVQVTRLKEVPTKLHDYMCFVLMDFVTVDRSLEELPLAAALVLAEQAGWKERLADIAVRELRLRKRQFDKLDREKTSLLARTEENSAP